MASFYNPSLSTDFTVNDKRVFKNRALPNGRKWQYIFINFGSLKLKRFEVLKLTIINKSILLIPNVLSTGLQSVLQALVSFNRVNTIGNGIDIKTPVRLSFVPYPTVFTFLKAEWTVYLLFCSVVYCTVHWSAFSKLGTPTPNWINFSNWPLPIVTIIKLE